MTHSASRSLIKGMCPYIEVYDMPVSLQFYRDILGFMIVHSSGEGDDVDWVLLQLDETELMLNTAYEKESRPEQPDPVRIQSHLDTKFFFGSPDIDSLYLYLKEKGVAVQEPYITGYGWKAISLKDPDGYGLCFHCRIS